jgi:hypothetical protein
MDYSGNSVIQFGSFRYINTSTPRNSPRSQNSPRTPNKSPRSQNSPRSHVKYNNIQEQLDFAEVKYQEVLNKYMNTPYGCITSKQQDDVWAWGIFSEVVLPMLKIVDDE